MKDQTKSTKKASKKPIVIIIFVITILGFCCIIGSIAGYFIYRYITKPSKEEYISATETDFKSVASSVEEIEKDVNYLFNPPSTETFEEYVNNSKKAAENASQFSTKVNNAQDNIPEQIIFSIHQAQKLLKSM
jgi:hypothetical protein